MYKIGIIGAHGTGKTTLGNLLATELNLFFITNTMRSMWIEYGVSEFEKLPVDVRATFQKYAILRQISFENNQLKSGFITDRTVLDNLAYTHLSSSMTNVDLDLYITLATERLNNYSHFIYLPVMFEPPHDSLRADIKTRAKLAEIMEKEMLKYIPNNKLLVVKSLANNDRVSEVKQFLGA